MLSVTDCRRVAVELVVMLRLSATTIQLACLPACLADKSSNIFYVLPAQ